MDLQSPWPFAVNEPIITDVKLCQDVTIHVLIIIQAIFYTPLIGFYNRQLAWI